MPRVLPSDIVRMMERIFDGQLGEKLFGIQADEIPKYQALVSLVEAVPTELLTLDPAEYAALLASVGYLRGLPHAFRNMNSITLALSGYHNPVMIIYEALKVCRDEAPSLGTTGLAFVDDEDLRESIRLDMSTANTNLEAGEWKGSTVLAGSAVEALLLWALQRHNLRSPGSIRSAIVALRATKTLDVKPDADLETMGLHNYIEIALALKLIRENTATLVRLAKDFRNLIHPGRAARLKQECSRATALTALGAMEAIARDLETTAPSLL